MLTVVVFWAFHSLLRQCKFRQQGLAGHRPQSTEAERLRDQGRNPRKFQGNTRAVLQLLTLISRHRLLSRWGPFLDAVNITIEALTTKTLPSPAAASDDGRRDPSEEGVPAMFGGLVLPDLINAFAPNRTKPNMNPPTTVPYITEAST